MIKNNTVKTFGSERLLLGCLVRSLATRKRGAACMPLSSASENKADYSTDTEDGLLPCASGESPSSQILRKQSTTQAAFLGFSWSYSKATFKSENRKASVVGLFQTQNTSWLGKRKASSGIRLDSSSWRSFLNCTHTASSPTEMLN